MASRKKGVSSPMTPRMSSAFCTKDLPVPLRQLTATMRPRTISRTAKTSCRPLVAATETAAVVAVAGMVPKKP